MLTVLDPSTVPPNYELMLSRYASKGFRVMAIGSRKLEEEELAAGREKVERNLNFDGFEVFENELKPGTREAIAELKEARLEMVMVTGDSTFTACSVALESGMTDNSKALLIVNEAANKLTA